MKAELCHIIHSRLSHVLLLSSRWASFLWLLLLDIYVYICMHKYINTACWVCFCHLCVFMVSGLTTLHWKTSKSTHPWETLVPPTPRHVLPVDLVRGETPLEFLPPLMSICPSILLFFWSCLWRHFEEKLFHHTLPSFLVLTIFPLPSFLVLPIFLPLLPQCSLGHRCWSCDIDITNGAGFPMIYWYLGGIQLWFSVMDSMSPKETLLWWGVVGTPL